MGVDKSDCAPERVLAILQKDGWNLPGSLLPLSVLRVKRALRHEGELYTSFFAEFNYVQLLTFDISSWLELN